jgi:hypothetical protein
MDRYRGMSASVPPDDGAARSEAREPMTFGLESSASAALAGRRLAARARVRDVPTVVRLGRPR